MKSERDCDFWQTTTRKERFEKLTHRADIERRKKHKQTMSNLSNDGRTRSGRIVRNQSLLSGTKYRKLWRSTIFSLRTTPDKRKCSDDRTRRIGRYYFSSLGRKIRPTS